jgi:hypothetical protein
MAAVEKHPQDESSKTAPNESSESPEDAPV